MNVLVDTSVWIDYFKQGTNSYELDMFIEQNMVCVNELILAELIPFLKVRKEYRVIKLLESVTNIPLNINWENIIKSQTKAILKGINKVGIPDLIIIDNVVQNDLVLYSLGKHFRLLNKHIKFEIL